MNISDPLVKCVGIIFCSGLASFLSIVLLKRLLRDHGVMDIPNQRSSHTVPVPRGGGLGILFGLVTGALIFGAGSVLLSIPLVIGLTIISFVGLMDDMSGGLSPLVRLAVQTGAALIVLLSVGGMNRLPFPEPYDLPVFWLTIPLGLIWIVGVTNLYNFLDGIDGYAGVQGLIFGVIMAWALWPSPASWLFVSIAGGCAGFLFHNWKPASIFMGDTGSSALGFLFATAPFIISRTEKGRASLVWLTAMLLWFFLSDGLFTIINRVCKREKIWEAHRSHLYQRLVRAGAKHSTVVAIVMIPTLLLGASAAWAWKNRDPGWMWIVFALAVIAFAVYWLVVRIVEKRANVVAADT